MLGEVELWPEWSMPLPESSVPVTWILCPTCLLRSTLEPSAFSVYEVPLPEPLALAPLDDGLELLGDEVLAPVLAPLPLSALVRTYCPPDDELLDAELPDPPGEVRHPVTVMELPALRDELPGCVVGL